MKQKILCITLIFILMGVCGCGTSTPATSPVVSSEATTYAGNPESSDDSYSEPEVYEVGDTYTVDELVIMVGTGDSSYSELQDLVANGEISEETFTKVKEILDQWSNVTFDYTLEEEFGVPDFDIFNFHTNFSEGYAWVSMYDNSEMIIDNKGNVCYEKEGAIKDALVHDFTKTNVKDGHTMVAQKFIIDTNGNISYQVPEDFEDNVERIIGEANGLYLLYQKYSGIEGTTNKFSLIDYNGNIKGTVINPEFKVERFHTPEFEYVGDDWYLIDDRYVVSFINNEIYKLDQEYEHVAHQFKDGKAIFAGLKPYVLNESDMSIKKIDIDINYNNEYEQGIFYIYNNSYYDVYEDKLIEIKSYPDLYKVGYTFIGDYALVYIKGGDGNDYFTAVDKSGNFMFEPIMGNLSFDHHIDGYIVAKTHDGVFNIYDINGNVVHSISDDVSEFQIGSVADVGEGFLKIYSGSRYYVYYLPHAVECGNEIYDFLPSKEEVNDNTNASDYSDRQYKKIKNFSIIGKWKNIGTYGFGQAQEGAIVVFDGSNCNFFSPCDTYAFSENGDYYTLECTSFMSTATLSFDVKTIDKNHIDIIYAGQVIELEKVK